MVNGGTMQQQSQLVAIELMAKAPKAGQPKTRLDPA